LDQYRALSNAFGADTAGIDCRVVFRTVELLVPILRKIESMIRGPFHFDFFARPPVLALGLKLNPHQKLICHALIKS
jgi:hypothetical protein